MSCKSDCCFGVSRTIPLCRCAGSASGAPARQPAPRLRRAQTACRSKGVATRQHLLALLLLLHTYFTSQLLVQVQAGARHWLRRPHEPGFEQLPAGRLESPSYLAATGLQARSLGPGERLAEEPRLPALASTKLAMPKAVALAYSHGPGLDLVGLNRRRFEAGHEHSHAESSHSELEQAGLMEAQLAALTSGLKAAELMGAVNKQVAESLSLELGADASAGDDYDELSIKRLTKSCLSVHASSNRPEFLNVSFLLFTRKNPQQAYVMGPTTSWHELQSAASPFDARLPLKWITHGFHTNVDKSEWMVEMKDKILAYEEANVILTDWRRGASPALAFYPKAAANAHVVAKMIVNILRRMRPSLDLGRVHFIGHSLGAHIMGFVGSAFTEEYLHERQQALAASPDQELPYGAGAQWPATAPPKALIGRITACDPALPCFGPSSSAPSRPQPVKVNPVGPQRSPAAALAQVDWTPSMWTHLRPDSALLVEVIHSNPGLMGYAEALGDYDFYPNGFERQPGCGQARPAPEQPQRAAHVLPAAEPDEKRRLSLPVQRRQLGVWWSYLFGAGLAKQQPAAAAASRQSQGASKLNSALGHILKPIKDLVLGYTCSHHRAIDYLIQSMYYERRPAGADSVCQMVGYRCSDYTSFKRGLCFRCQTELDCRSIAVFDSVPVQAAAETNQVSYDQQQQLVQQKFLVHAAGNATNLGAPTKRALPNASGHFILPTYSNQRQPANKYFYDTKSSKDYCAYHYHLLIKYKWFRVRESLSLDSLEVLGSKRNESIVLRQQLFHRYSLNSYTSLLVEPDFLGQIQLLILTGDYVKPSLIEYIEITFMSNLDAKVRNDYSGRLCWLPARPTDWKQREQASSLFVPCSGLLV